MSLFTAIRDVYQGAKSLLIGLRITAREASRPSITVQYPHETLPMPARFRGHIKLILDPETGKPRCTACMLCERACPSGCIVLDGVKREGEKKKSVSKYELDFTTCSLCGACVEACPSEALEFSREYNAVSMDRGDFSHMDLYKKVGEEAKVWAQNHPTAPVDIAPEAAPATTVPAAPAAPAAPSAAPKSS